MKPVTAAECVQEYEGQYLQGLRTKLELLGAYMRVAGEFGAEALVLAVSPAYLSELFARCGELPSQEELFVVGASRAESDLHYRGLERLHEYAKSHRK